MSFRKSVIVLSLISMFYLSAGPVFAKSGKVLNEPVDISDDFRDFKNTYYVPKRLVEFDPSSASGKISYQRYQYTISYSFNNTQPILEKVEGNEFPATEYPESPELPFAIEFVSPRTVRIKAKSGLDTNPEGKSLMLTGGRPARSSRWQLTEIEGGYRYASKYGSITVRKDQWNIEFRNAEGKLLTKTLTGKGELRTIFSPILPFSFVRRASDYSRSFSAAFKLSPSEKIFGCGESFTRLNKREQKVVLYVDDAMSSQTDQMYKPVPFFMSSRGYGIFMHTSSPVTCDFGKSFNEICSLMIGDEELDLFFFFGEPKDILDEYTDLTGKASMPPLWSFGLWMSRITYSSENQVRNVAGKLRENQIPCDVIHLDTGWFETDWRCDYKFSESRFDDPEKMISDLKDSGFHISLWQLPYFTPKNKLFPEIIEKELFVKNRKGNLPTKDAILDFSNPQTIEWYQQHIADLLKMGVGAIKVDFGEGAPYEGIFASGRTGFYEHNLYPLRYNKAAAEITEEVTGNRFIWARSAWAGSQRYPVHWGGDCENTYSGMKSQLRGGLSFGLSGFSFWSHDIGGFVTRPPKEIYRRWLPFGMLTSHSRCHGIPPKEPWAYGKEFMDDFRRAVEMKYKLTPYVYAQAKHCTENGLPMVRALFVEYPDDAGSWLIEDEYLFGSDILVAPLFHSGTGRDVYLPEGKWIDYQTNEVYQGGWHHIEAGKILAVILVRNGSVVPHIKPAQSTMQMDFSEIELVTYAEEKKQSKGMICLPFDNRLHNITVSEKDGKLELKNDPYKDKVTWKTIKHTKYETTSSPN